MMTANLESVLQISVTGTAILFSALAGLIGLMYLLTAPWLFEPPAADNLSSSEATSSQDGAGQESQARRRRAAALAVAVACASATRPLPDASTSDSDWRRLHHSRRLGHVSPRARART